MCIMFGFLQSFNILIDCSIELCQGEADSSSSIIVIIVSYCYNLVRVTKRFLDMYRILRSKIDREINVFLPLWDKNRCKFVFTFFFLITKFVFTL